MTNFDFFLGCALIASSSKIEDKNVIDQCAVLAEMMVKKSEERENEENSSSEHFNSVIKYFEGKK